MRRLTVALRVVVSRDDQGTRRFLLPAWLSVGGEIGSEM